jgi:TolA-binding protein
MQSDVTEIQRQLLQVQELTGLSQRRLSELKTQIDQRAEQSEAAGVTRPVTAAAGDSTAPPPAAAPTASAEQMYQGARSQLTRGALGTARRGFQEFLRVYPNHPQVPDALNSVGESFAVEQPDSAVAYYSMVVISHKNSSAAPTALYKLGRLEETRNNSAGARAYYERLVRDYPRSDLIEVVRDRLKNLRP